MNEEIDLGLSEIDKFKLELRDHRRFHERLLDILDLRYQIRDDLSIISQQDRIIERIAYHKGSYESYSEYVHSNQRLNDNVNHTIDKIPDIVYSLTKMMDTTTGLIKELQEVVKIGKEQKVPE
jgi:hypothetical protein